MANFSVQRKCPCCSGTNLRRGAIPDSGAGTLGRLRFKPEENWVTTHELMALACADCGHVSLYLYEDGLHALRSE